MNRAEAIADITKRLALIDEVLEVGDVNHEQYEELVKVYTAGVVLKAQLQATQTMRERKDSYKYKESRNDE